jgi:trk system potassium uptake protein TrkH
MIIAAVDDISLRKLVFEVVSAENTVGVTMGITRDLSVISQTLIMALMFIGRIGGFTLALLFLEGTNPPPKSRPTEKMLVG